MFGIFCLWSADYIHFHSELRSDNFVLILSGFFYKNSLFFFNLLAVLWHVGYEVPDQELNPPLLHWQRGVLTTGPPGKSEAFHVFLNLLDSLLNSAFQSLTLPYHKLINVNRY